MPLVAQAPRESHPALSLPPSLQPSPGRPLRVSSLFCASGPAFPVSLACTLYLTLPHSLHISVRRPLSPSPRLPISAYSRSPSGGNTFVGVCAAKFSCWDTAWWDDRQEHEPYIFGLFDRGTLTRPSHDRQKDWLERSRYRNGVLSVFLRATDCVAAPRSCKPCSASLFG